MTLAKVSLGMTVTCNFSGNVDEMFKEIKKKLRSLFLFFEEKVSVLENV